MDAAIEAAVQDDGGLFDGGNYLCWTPGEAMATLDGAFTAAQLRDIADHMDRTQTKAT